MFVVRAGIGVVIAVLSLFGLIGCGRSGPSEVVVYTALDQEFSAPIFAEFTRSSGIVVKPKYDTESTKTVGLTNAIIAERSGRGATCSGTTRFSTRCAWSGRACCGRISRRRRPSYPLRRSIANGMWYGFAARARVLVVNTNRVPEERRPKSIHDLADPQWYEQCGIAKPLFGTTATHAACLFAAWGDERRRSSLRSVKRNARIMSGNKQVAQAVASGSIAFGLTDTDDAIVEIEHGMPVAIVYPDQGEGELGTLFIPNTLAIIKDSPNPEAARSWSITCFRPTWNVDSPTGPAHRFRCVRACRRRRA